MNDIEVLIVKKPRPNRPTSVMCQRERLVLAENTKREIYDYGLKGNVTKVSVDDLSKRVDANLVVILDEDTYVPEDFINRIVSFNNLFRDAGILCGPVYPTLDSQFSKSYYTYDLKFGTSVVSDISKEPNSYPSIIGSVITGQAYNSFLYNPVKSTRHSSADNSFFVSSVAKQYKIYYSPKLFKARYLDKSDLDIKVLSDYYYNLGYQDGMALSAKSKNEKTNELYDRFINSPEMFDNTMPRWLFESISMSSDNTDQKTIRAKPEVTAEYVEILVLTKCKYQIGFYEGMLGKEVI